MSLQLWTNARVATLATGAATPYGLIEDGAVAVQDGRIAWVGARKELPLGLDDAAAEHDAQGGLITPGLIDCHTHLVYAGDRSDEFERRLKGVTYEEIARSGGGIMSTVRATRAASEAQLRRESQRRVEALASQGVTTVEIKSGYGLELASELKCLRVARSLGEGRARIVTTLLAAHAVPPEFSGRADDYVAHICSEIIPAVAREKLADAVDAFCEGIAFSPAQTRSVFECARRHGLRVKLHADQLSNLGGAALAAEFNALSADHLEHTDEAGLDALLEAGTVAVLLPGAFYYLRETKLPPIEALRQRAIPMAIATDCNPGTSPITSPSAILNMACTLFRLTPEEALAGMTCHAARALGLEDETGTLEPGKRADLAIWEADHPAQLSAQIGMPRVRSTFVAGKLCIP